MLFQVKSISKGSHGRSSFKCSILPFYNLGLKNYSYTKTFFLLVEVRGEKSPKLCPEARHKNKWLKNIILTQVQKDGRVTHLDTLSSSSLNHVIVFYANDFTTMLLKYVFFCYNYWHLQSKYIIKMLHVQTCKFSEVLEMFASVMCYS